VDESSKRNLGLTKCSKVVRAKLWGGGPGGSIRPLRGLSMLTDHLCRRFGQGEKLYIRGATLLGETPLLRGGGGIFFYFGENSFGNAFYFEGQGKRSSMFIVEKNSRLRISRGGCGVYFTRGASKAKSYFKNAAPLVKKKRPSLWA